MVASCNPPTPRNDWLVALVALVVLCLVSQLGCSAPMAKDPEAAEANMGLMKLRQFGAAEGTAEGAGMSRAEAQLMIRHPNNSGLQMDQLTRLYIPAHFVRDVTIRQGDLQDIKDIPVN